MRLIDVDKLIETLEENISKLARDIKLEQRGMQLSIFVAQLCQTKHIIGVIDEQPTAFNVDKVVEKLEEQISKHDLLFNKYVKDKDKSCSWSISELNKIRGLLEAIDVVKAGGTDESAN